MAEDSVKASSAGLADRKLGWRPGEIWQYSVITSEAAEDPHHTLQLAIEELTAFARQSAGVRLEPLAESPTGRVWFILQPQEDGFSYLVQAEAEELRFQAASSVDLLYAVYDFAECWLGMSFFEPGVDRCPPRAARSWPVGRILGPAKPLLENRGFIQEFPPNDQSFILADWMARNRLNYLLTWMKHYDQFSEELKVCFAQRGIRIEAGHHNFDYYLPMSRYYTDHPEYFAVIDGRRVEPEADDQALLLSKQICATHPGVRAVLAERMAEYARLHPEVDILSLVPNDGFGWCECDCCSAFYDKTRRGDWFSVSAHVYPAQKLYHDLVQDVAARLEKIRPGLGLSFVAYVNYVEPAEGFELRENMSVHLALYWRCINHRIDDLACPINQRYLRAIDAWRAAKRGGTVNIYEYYMGVNFYISLPMIHHRQVFGEVRALAERGMDGVLTQFHLSHWTAYGLNYHLFARAAWGEDEQGVIDRVFSALFGAARPQAEALYAALHAIQRAGTEDGARCLVPVPRLLLGAAERRLFTAALQRANELVQALPDEPLAQALQAWGRYLDRLKEAFDLNAAGHQAAPLLEAIMADVQQADRVHAYAESTKVARLLAGWIKTDRAGQRWCHFGLEWEDAYILGYERAEGDPVAVAALEEKKRTGGQDLLRLEGEGRVDGSPSG